MLEAERRRDEGLYARAARLFQRHVDCAWDPVFGGVFRGLRGRSHEYMLDGDCKVKWAHDEVCVGCCMILAHVPVACLSETIGSGTDGDTADPPMATWALETLRRVYAYVDANFRLIAQPPGSWKVGGDRLVKPDPDPDTGISG